MMVDASSQSDQVNLTGINEHLPLIRETCVAIASVNQSETDSASSCDQDDDWKPPESSGSESGETAETDWNERKFLIFESYLMQLFVICSTCLPPVTTIRKSLYGSMLKIPAECHKGHQINCSSQPVHNRTLRVREYGNNGLKHGGKDVFWPMSLVTKGRFSIQHRPQFKLLWRENIHHFVFCLANEQGHVSEKHFTNFETKTSQ